MKKLTMTMGIALAALAMSCEETALDGDWDPIKTDRSMVILPKAGGRDTIRLKNYSQWWLSQVDVRQGDTTVHRMPEMGSTNSSDYYLTMEGDWFSIEIPRNNRQLLIIDMKENSRPVFPRELNIGVTVGDAFATLRAIQAASD